MGVLAAYLLTAGEVFLATAVRGMFRMSFAGIGPTELRLLLAGGAIALFRDPQVNLGTFGSMPLFDVGGVIATVGLCVAATLSALRNTAALAREEPPRQ